MNRPDITAVILAAGFSERMGCFKPLLKIGEQTLIERAISLFRDAGIKDIRVVVGHLQDRLQPILEKNGIQAILNKENSPEMFSSVLAALNSLEPGVRALIMLPVDIPLIRPWTIRYLIKQYHIDRYNILIPDFRGKRGHPVIIPAEYFSVIKTWNGENGLKGALGHLADKSVFVPVADANILFDVDTMEDYEACRERWLRYHTPTREECEAILKDVARVDEDIYSHSLAVSGVAEKICKALARSGCSIDCDQTIAAALPHDLAKGSPRHDRKAADMLTEMGYTAIAPIVAAHIDIDCSSRKPVNSAEVLYLADKLVKGAAIVSLAERFQGALETTGHDPEIRKKIEKRFQHAEVILKKIEAAVGDSLSMVVNMG